MALGLRIGKSPQELRDEFTHRERTEYVVTMIGIDKFDGRSPLQRQLDALVGLG